MKADKYAAKLDSYAIPPVHSVNYQERLARKLKSARPRKLPDFILPPKKESNHE